MAIAFDASAVATLVNPGTSSTWAHTCTGANGILFVGVFGDLGAAGHISGATYNAVAMTQIASIQVPGDRWLYLFYLLNPASGANNVVVSAAASIAIQGMSSSYTGAKQTGQPDASSTNTQGGSSVSHLIGTLTTVLANCWTVAIYKSNAIVVAAGTGLARQNQNSTIIFDSNAALSIGSTTLQGNSNTNSSQAIIMASFSPVPPPPVVAAGSFLDLM